jgi:S-adenosylmethionine decarboxylase
MTVTELIVDAYGCSGDLSDADRLMEAAREATRAIGATIAEESCHRFQPHGLTFCLILKESHLIVSTWPEHNLAIVNIFLCNPEMSTHKAWECLSKVLKPSRTTFHSVDHKIGKPAKAISAA